MLNNKFKDYVKVESIGKSYEGRDIDMIIISKSKGQEMKNVVFIDSNIHAREWISSSTALYFIDYLTKNRTILNFVDFYIVPCLNPDGYEFTHTTMRLWRKNRNTNGTDDLKMQGVDLNRNFPYGYGLEGSSEEPSSFMYRGACPFSEPEAQALANVLARHKHRIKLYLSLHAYGNVIMYPWGFTSEPVDDYKTLERCGNVMKNAMMAESCKNRHFKVGSVANLMYLSSGGTSDYAKGTLKIKFAYIVELQKFGKSGFTPKTKNIAEIGREATAGILAMTKFVHRYYKKKVWQKNAKCKKKDKNQFSY